MIKNQIINQVNTYFEIFIDSRNLTYREVLLKIDFVIRQTYPLPCHKHIVNFLEKHV